MEYRKLPHGGQLISTIGVGMGGIHTGNTNEQIEEILRFAMDNGINFFDMCCGNLGVYNAFGNAAHGRRDKVYTQMHFGAVYEDGNYGRKRDLDLVKSSFEEALKRTGGDYTDFGMAHCIDEEDDFNLFMKEGTLDYMVSLKEQGIVKHLGFSTHTPSMARKFLETGVMDIFMFSINPVYDFTKGKYGYGSYEERISLYELAEKMGVGISVMKPFAAGQLLSLERSPINVELTPYQCVKYVLDRPAVLTALPGIHSLDEVKSILGYANANESDLDYSVIKDAAPADSADRCVYCNHCAPCPVGIDIGLVNKYYDLAVVGDDLARDHYMQLTLSAQDCIGCGNCAARCPFNVNQPERMQKILSYFGK